MKADLKTVKISGAAYDAIRAAREELLRRGINALPQELVQPPNCPVCGSDLEHLEVAYQHLHCSRCNYRQQTLTATSENGVALGIGVLIGLGAAALLNALAGPEERKRTLKAKKLKAFARSSRGSRKSCPVRR